MAYAAHPQLATQLLQSLSTCPPAPASLSTSYFAVDDALQGGLEYGLVTAIAGGPNTGKTLISSQLLLSHLLASSNNEAAVIDTTGLFEPLWLLQLLRQRLETRRKTSREERRRQRERRGKGDKDDEVKGEDDEDNDTQDRDAYAMSVLDRVRVMRVFDFVGVVEAVAEIRAELESGVVMDSQDDDSEDGDEGEVGGIGNEVKGVGNGKGRVGFLLVDSLMGVLGELMRTSHVQGHAVMTTFLRSLSLLTARQQLCVILINGAVGSGTSGIVDGIGAAAAAAAVPAIETGMEDSAAPRRQHTHTATRGNEVNRSNDNDDNVSIFASNKGKPALGRTFTQCVDLRLWLSRVPRRKADAVRLAAAAGGREGGKGGEGRGRAPLGGSSSLSSSEVADEVGICEVLGDRQGGREGRWGVFELKRKF